MLVIDEMATPVIVELVALVIQLTVDHSHDYSRVQS